MRVVFLNQAYNRHLVVWANAWQ